MLGLTPITDFPISDIGGGETGQVSLSCQIDFEFTGTPDDPWACQSTTDTTWTCQ